MSGLEKHITDLPGFKISDSHFRIGSKIHISDFYYAKRFFQNGFFASRVAFILARDIAKDVEEKGHLDQIRKQGLTLVGYEMYSVLLISLVDKFLRLKWKIDSDKLNHNIYEDADSLKLCKNYNFLGHIIIIVPIASTFSTAIKIENKIVQTLKEKGVKASVLQPHYNVLYISDGKLSEVKTELENYFGWETKDLRSKVISIRAFYAQNKGASPFRDQKFYLSVPTRWFNVENCKHCNPLDAQGNENPRAELPLFETDRTTVTPSIIFDFPKGRQIAPHDLQRKYAIDSASISYGHSTRNNSHFLYAIDSENFLELNRKRVENWLNMIKISPAFKSTYKETDYVIIISACHYSNAAFINLINEYLFSASATIIHYDPSNDYIQNFKMIYGKELNEADKIYFIDDSLKSGSAFDRIYQFVQNTVHSTDGESKGISACFFLLNKSQPYIFDGIKTKLINEKLIHSFANLHLYTSLKPDETSPLQLEEDRYLELARNCFLDSLKVHFINQAKKLNPDHNTSGRSAEPLKAARHLDMLIATHRIYEYFRIAEKPLLGSFNEFMTDVIAQTESPLEQDKVYLGRTSKFLSNTECAYLKVLSQSPFTQYKPLRTSVFKWTLTLLTEFVAQTKEDIANGTFSYKHFQQLKFLIRRAGLLNSNYLFSNSFFKFLQVLYQQKGIPAIINDYEKKIGNGKNFVPDLYSSAEEIKESLSKLKDFHIFYAAQVKELLLTNESRCIRIESNLKELEKSENPNIRQIVRVLREENAIIIQSFYTFIRDMNEWKQLYIPDNTKEDYLIDYSNDKIKKLLNEPFIAHHQKYKSLNTFLNTTQQKDGAENLHFLNYLWLQYFLTFDKQKKKLDLNDKTDYIMSKMIDLIKDSGMGKPGAFLIVNDNQRLPFMVYNRNRTGTTELDISKWNKDEMAYLRLFLNGASDDLYKTHKHYKTIIEFKRNEQQEWEDLYGTGDRKASPGLGRNIISMEYNRLILIRLNKRNSFLTRAHRLVR